MNKNVNKNRKQNQNIYAKETPWPTLSPSSFMSMSNLSIQKGSHKSFMLINNLCSSGLNDRLQLSSKAQIIPHKKKKRKKKV